MFTCLNMKGLSGGSWFFFPHKLYLALVGAQNLQNVSWACGSFQVLNNQSPEDSGRNVDLPAITAGELR